MNVARIWATEVHHLRTVTIHAGWAVDNFYETSMASTVEEAIDLAVAMWNTPLENIFIVTGPEKGARVLGTAKQRNG